SPYGCAGAVSRPICPLVRWTLLNSIDHLNQLKRRKFAMFAMKSRFWLVRCAALMWLIGTRAMLTRTCITPDSTP
ncbi:MAG: hypothetical protein KGK01_08780, partial [Bradyrhizobium sp.]|nr:hypothetical protein [Bradyrhizobium sp.]